MREDLKVLVRDHASYKRWEVRYQNALKLKRDGDDQKRPTPYEMTEEYRNRVTALLDQSGVWTDGISKQIGKAVHELPIWKEWAVAVKPMGELTIGYLEAYVDLDRASDSEGRVVVSKVWRFCGYGAPEDKRGERGKKRCYCAAIKTQLYQWGLSLEKLRNQNPSAYGAIYDGTKARLEQSDNVVEERKKNGSAEVAWKDARPGHRRDAAIRRAIKEMLKDYVKARAALEGRTVRPPYAEEYLGKKHCA